MNCPNPNCNKEVSPEWKLCPFCGYEPKKCSNTKHAPRWLPQEAKFCPECGEPLESVMTSPSPSPSPVLKERNVSVGDILCTDNTTVPVSEWPVAGKTAMGVVFYVDDTGKHGWAVHLQDQGKCQWTPDGKEMEVYGLCKCDTEESALADKDGYTNTKVLRAAGDTSVYPAAYAVEFNQGWYLPAMGQLKKLYDLRERLNTSLLKVKGEKIKVTDWYWSSTQKSYYSAWYVYSHGYVDYYYKYATSRVRSVRAF